MLVLQNFHKEGVRESVRRDPKYSLMLGRYCTSYRVSELSSVRKLNAAHKDAKVVSGTHTSFIRQRCTDDVPSTAQDHSHLKSQIHFFVSELSADISFKSMSYTGASGTCKIRWMFILPSAPNPEC